MATIGQVAWNFNVSTSFLRKYEKLGLIPNPPRTPTNRRNYGQSELNAITIFLDNKQKQNNI